jgi:4-amino-4-deoxy-L-arabinose transferase-like glycosyltransferase
MQATVLEARRARTLRVALQPHVLALGGVATISAYLNCWALAQNGYANTYYAGAVRSMLHSWSNFVFVAFDRGGMETVDKPPLALWVQAASARVFGYSSLSLLLPEAIAGVAGVLVLYLAVARVFGRWPGVAASLVLAASPVAVAVQRDNNPDALFVLLLVVAAYCGVRAVEAGSRRWLLATGAAVGLAFETKMLVALVVVPALGLAYLAFAPGRPGRRILDLAFATLVMVVVGGAWIAAVALTPASDRPWIAGTSDNSALSLMLDYNGLGRVTGQTGGTSTGGGPGVLFSGTPGLLRLINASMGDQGGWLLPFALVAGVTAVVLAIRARDRLRLGALTIFGGWFLTGAVVFSFSSGIIHTYYVSAIAPPIAALVGAGSGELVRAIRRWPLAAAVAVACVAATAWLEIVLVRRAGYETWLMPAIGTIATVAAALLAMAAIRPSLAVPAMVVALGGLLLAPAVWANSTHDRPIDGVLPGAGPSANGGGQRQAGTQPPAGMQPPGGFQAAGMQPPGGAQLPAGNPPAGGGGSPFAATTGVSELLAYVRAHGATSRFPLILEGQSGVGGLVARGSAVAAMGGFTGRESSESAARIAELVAAGDARYFLIGSGGGGPGGLTAASGARSAITAVCSAVNSSAWSTSGSSGTLYDCSGKAAALRSAG